MIPPDLIDALTPIVEVFERLGVPYYVGGSAASSVLGLPRSTVDVDIVADLEAEQVEAFVSHLEDSYYVDTEMILGAIRNKRSFNLIHLPTMLKVDVFLLKGGAFDRAELARVKPHSLDEGPEAKLFLISSPEDVVLRKIDWFKMGGGVSERQWLDVLGVLKVQAPALDYDYLWHWAHELGVGELLGRALVDAGLDDKVR